MLLRESLTSNRANETARRFLEPMRESDPPDPSSEGSLLEPPASDRPPSSSIDGGRFVAGTVLAARYRIMGLIGRGGMGEVYRAEDLTLGEHVALKFLPQAVARDPDALARLHREVRTSRQITHRNVVRVHDVGEVDGEPFLSMEFVQGEDLASLLRRIGRLPEEKGVALARQICAGLGAAHERGVLHRDLKPANVMLDADGNAKLTDFGLAAFTTDATHGERVGTPAYMAPEQFADGSATPASDIFSLGLVLHEIFTGERAIRASTLSELHARHTTPFAGPSERVAGLDPAVDCAVRRCLALAPADRPDSALRVAGALPGGDPLAQALAAGETPSPELVARAEGPPALSAVIVGSLLAVALIAFGFVVWLFGNNSIYQLDGTPLERAVLEHRARELAIAAGAFELAPGCGRFELDDAARALSTRDAIGTAAERRPGLVQFVYRAGEMRIAPVTSWFGSGARWDDPPTTTPGTIAVRLDSRGHLIEIVIAHRERPRGMNASDTMQAASAGQDARAVESKPFDAAPWFEAAGLDRTAFHATTPNALPPIFADRVMAWTRDAHGENGPLMIDAASLHGHLVWWRMRASAAEDAPAPNLGAALLVFTAMCLVGGWFAVRSVRAGRADVRGATVLALLVSCTYLLGSWLPDPATFLAGGPSLVFRMVAYALLFGTVTWGTYAALEPALRRTLPSALRSWNRLIRGGFGDPFVHRDLFLGIAVGLIDLGLVCALEYDPAFVRSRFPHGPAALQGAGAVVASVLHLMLALVPIALFFLFGAPRLVVRKAVLADVLGATLVTLFLVGFSGLDPTTFLTAAAVVALTRFVGFLALFGYAFVPVTLQLTPFTWDTTHWWATLSMVAPAVLLACLLTTALRARLRVQR